MMDKVQPQYLSLQGLSARSSLSIKTLRIIEKGQERHMPRFMVMSRDKNRAKFKLKNGDYSRSEKM